MRLSSLLLTALLAALAVPPLSALEQDEESKPVSNTGTHEVAAGDIGMAPPERSTGTSPSEHEEKSSKRASEALPNELRSAVSNAQTALAGAQAALDWKPGPQNPPAGSGCKVVPPNVKIGVVIHNRPQPGKFILDSTPKSCDRAFCAAVGFGGRSCCPFGPEGSAERVSCERFVLGTDRDTGVSGPHWIFVGPGRIKQNNSNPFLGTLHIEGAGGGMAYACGNRGQFPVCGSVQVP